MNETTFGLSWPVLKAGLRKALPQPRCTVATRQCRARVEVPRQAWKLLRVAQNTAPGLACAVHGSAFRRTEKITHIYTSLFDHKHLENHLLY